MSKRKNIRSPVLKRILFLFALLGALGFGTSAFAATQYTAGQSVSFTTTTGLRYISIQNISAADASNIWFTINGTRYNGIYYSGYGIAYPNGVETDNQIPSGSNVVVHFDASVTLPNIQFDKNSGSGVVNASDFTTAGSAVVTNVVVHQAVDTTAPTDVTNVTGTNITDTGLSLNWSASVSSDVSSYQVYKGLELLGSTALTSYDVSGLTPETAYQFTIKAVDGSNNVSTGTTVQYSTVAAPVVPPTNNDTGGDSNMTTSLFPSLEAAGITTQAETWANNFDALLLVVVGVGLGFAAVRFVKSLFF